MNTSAVSAAKESVGTQLLALLSPRAQEQLAAVKRAITDDPRCLDNHSRELRGKS